MTTLAQLNSKWRVVDEDRQWMLQFRRGTTRRATGATPEEMPRWRGRSYCLTRPALLRLIKEHCGEVDAAALALIEALPEKYQIEEKPRRGDEAGRGVLKMFSGVNDAELNPG